MRKFVVWSEILKKIVKNKYLYDLALCIIISAVLAFLYSFMAEAVRTGSVVNALEWLKDHTRTYIIGSIALLFVIAGLIYAVRRAYIASLLIGLLLLLGSFANYYKTLYRGDPLLPIDFVIALDAAKVSGALHMPISAAMWLFFGIIVASSALLFVLNLRLLPAPSKRFALLNVGLALCSIPILGIYLTFTVWNTALMAPLGVKIIPSDAALAYKNSGFITGYFLYAGNLSPSKPKNYNENAVLAAAQELSKPKATQRPDIFIVMLESYYHLDNYGDAVVEDITANYRRLALEGTSGYFLSDKYSGGTADMEFGALTGFATSFLPSGSVPYSEFVSKRETPSYPKFLKQHGYRSFAVHPYDPTIYKRNLAYPNLGFDEFISQDSFEPKDKSGVYISDKAVMDKLIEIYERERDNGPTLIHAVTMQNHIPNDLGEYPQDYTVNASYAGVPKEIEGSLVSVATGLRDEDAAIGYLADYLRKQKRPAVVLFFGDHQTSIGNHEGRELLDFVKPLKSYPPEAYALATHKVPYLMWANYETGNENKAGGLIPPYQLVAQLAGKYNLPRSAWFDYLYKTSTVLVGTNLGYIISPQGGLEGAPNAAQQQIIDTQRLLQYDALLGKRYAADWF